MLHLLPQQSRRVAQQGAAVSLPPLLESLSKPSPGGHQCLQILELCLNRRHSPMAGPGRAISWGFPRTPGAGTMPALVPRLSCTLGAAAFSPDILNVSCSSCPFPLHHGH